MKPEILWDPKEPLPAAADLRRPGGLSMTVVKPLQPEVDGYRFHHGAAICSHGGELLVSIGVNKGVENTAGEEAVVCRSGDGGRSWSAPQILAASEPRSGVSHGVFLADGDRLLALHARFGDIRSLPLAPGGAGFVGLAMLAFERDGKRWKPLGVACDDFWPLGEPVLLDDGRWFLAGVDNTFHAAVALSEPRDPVRWKRALVPVGGKAYSESSAWVDGGRLTLVMRNQSPANPAMACAAASVSRDGGLNWSDAVESNLPLAPSKPFCGRLSTGHRFLIGNSVRDHGGKRFHLTLCTARPGAEHLDRMWLLRTADSVTPGGDGAIKALAYPHAIEVDGTLHVVYSAGGGHNINRIELVSVPVPELLG